MSDSSSQMFLTDRMGDASTVPINTTTYNHADSIGASQSTEESESPVSESSQTIGKTASSASSTKKILYAIIAIVAVIIIVVALGFLAKKLFSNPPASSTLSVPVDATPILHSAEEQKIAESSFDQVAGNQNQFYQEDDTHGALLSGEPLLLSEEENDSSFYQPTPLQGTPVRNLFENNDESEEVSVRSSIYATPLTLERESDANVAERRKNQPPPASFFGASMKTRGEAAQDVPESVFNDPTSISNIYNKNANSVLAVNGISVRESVARDMGWSEINDSPPLEEGSSSKQPHSRPSKASLYDQIRDQIPLHEVRAGTSASTMVTADMAAANHSAANRQPEQIMAISSAGDERGNQFVAGRAKAHEITAQTQAAVGRIYQRKTQSSAGLSAASAAKISNQNDPAFEYINSVSSQPF